jgi:hypothetical protein
MGSLALRPGDSLAILVDGFVNGLQDAQFPSFLPFELRGLNFYPGGTPTHCSRQPSLDARRVEDWRGIPKVEPSRLLPVSSGSASIARP